MAGRSVPAPFLTKTYQLVDDASSDDVVSWSESGTTFVVWKTAEFAKDLLPNYFKHNNFSSFVRQLNTYGFRKIVPDKWEFANEYFRRGQRDLLSEIRRRKTAPASPARTAAAAAKTAGSLPSPSSSGEDLGSTSTSSPESKSSPRSDETAPAPPPHYAELSGENEKLKRDNEILSSELAQTKKQCEELMAFLAEYVKLGPDQINRIMWPQGSHASSRGGSDPVGAFNDGEDDSNGGYGDGRSGQEGEQEGEEEEEEEDRLKLFGVWLKGKKKRGREESMGCGGPHQREMKKMAPWMMGMKMAPAPGETSKVCN